MSKHAISIDQLKQLKSRYAENKTKILKEEFHDKATLPVSETFERTAFDQLLAQPGCVAVRIYFGMDENLEVNLVVVGVNDKNEDIQPLNSNSDRPAVAENIEGTVYALSDAARCPPWCPTDPPPPPPPDEK